MVTRYPAQIDSSLTLPTVVDNSTAIKAPVVNNLRDAILAIETELGIKPSGIDGTVRARLDSLEANVSGISPIPTGTGIPHIISGLQQSVSFIGTSQQVLRTNIISTDIEWVLPVVTFDDAIVGSNRNVRATRANSSPIDNTKFGQTAFGSTSFVDGTFPGIVNEDLGTVSGGAGQYAYGRAATIIGGERNEVDGQWGIAGGYHCIAKGEGSIAFGFFNSAGRIISDIGGEQKYATSLGLHNFSDGYGSLCIGTTNIVHWNSANGISIGINNIVGNDGYIATAGGALGDSCTSFAPAAWAIGNDNIAGGTNSMALGWSCTTTSVATSGALAIGRECISSDVSAIAIGQFAQATAPYTIALGLYASASRYGQHSQSSNSFATTVGSVQTCLLDLTNVAVGVTPITLLDFNGNPFLLEDSKVYALKITTLANRVDAPGRAMWINDLLVHCETGIAAIDNDNLTLEVVNGETWNIVFSVSGTSQALTATFTGTLGHTINVVASMQWVELFGFTGPDDVELLTESFDPLQTESGTFLIAE